MAELPPASELWREREYGAIPGEVAQVLFDHHILGPDRTREGKETMGKVGDVYDFDLDPKEIAAEDHYDGQYRPQFHYTPKQGFIGDATGLVYYKGEYHLFHMFDAWELRKKKHKRWGHAISRDLVYWEPLEPILDTLIDNKPGSGSGVVDWNDSSGLRKGPEKTLIVFYTDYKKGSCIAYSNDRGRTWLRHKDNPILSGIDNIRDPYVFWYEPDRHWRMARYEEEGFAFYWSSNLTDWTYLSRIEGFYECPDICQLPVDGDSNSKKWVLIDGNGTYTLGVFDGEVFVPETEKLRVDFGENFYATQTWKRTHHGDSPIVQIAWMSYPRTPRLTWMGQMSFPCQLTLRTFPEGIRLCRQPIERIKNLYIEEDSWHDLGLQPGDNPLAQISGDLFDIRAEIELAGASEFGIVTRGESVSYSVTDKTVSCLDRSAPLEPMSGRIKLRILVDRASIEVFGNDGKVSLSNAFFPNATDTCLEMFTKGGGIRVVSLEFGRIESIWLEADAKAGHPRHKSASS